MENYWFPDFTLEPSESVAENQQNFNCKWKLNAIVNLTLGMEPKSASAEN
jgi:hypothetical protein